MSRDDKPLEGRRIVVTRAAEQAAELTARLQELGAEVLLLPLVDFAPADETEPLDRALAEFGSFDWLLLTSQNAVRFLAHRARVCRVRLAVALAPGKARPRVGAVGRMTEQAAKAQGWRVDRVSGGRGGREMADELGAEIQGKRILLPRSDRATSELPEALAQAGAIPVPVVAYKTLAAPAADRVALEQLEAGGVDVVTFASPSAFHALEERLAPAAFRRLVANTRLAAIGPATAAAIREAGANVAIEAKVSTAAGLVAAIAAHFAAHPVISRSSP